MHTSDVPLFQSVAELFLTRYHVREGVGREAVYRFLLRYGVDPEFRAAIGREISSDRTKGEWREELGFVLALELVLSREGRWLFEQIVSKEKLTEMERTYPEVFLQGRGGRGKSARELIGESTAQSPSGRQDSPLGRALGDMFPEGADPSAVLAAMARQAGLLNAELAWMQDLESFHQALSQDVGKILDVLGERPEVDRYQAKRIQSRGEATEMVFCVVTEAAALRWFGSLDAEAADNVLRLSQNLAHDQESLAKAMERRRQWSEGAEEAARAIMSSAEALRQYSEPVASLTMYGSLLAWEGLGERTAAELHNRMAVIHREGGSWHDALMEFQEACILWERLDAGWEEAITSSFVAEAYAHLGKTGQATKYLEEAFDGLEGVDEGDERMAKGYFYLAACANGLGRLDLERRALVKGIHRAQNLDDADMLIEYNERLTALPK